MEKTNQTQTVEFNFNNAMECLSFLQSTLYVGKNSENNFAGYKYRNIAVINDALKPLLLQTKSTLLNYVEWTEFAGQLACIGIAELHFKDTSVRVEHLVFHAPSRPKMDQSQNAGATATYAMRYALQDMFLLGDDSIDPDKINDGKQDYEPTTVIKPEPQTVVWEGVTYNFNDKKERETCRAKVKEKIFHNSVEENRDLYKRLQLENSILLNKEFLDWCKQAADVSEAIN